MDSHRLIAFVTALFLAILIVLWSSSGSSKVSPFVYKAVAVFSGDSAVTGTVVFEQSSASAPVIITGDLKSLDPLSSRGFHIHQFGDATNGCMSAGSHFNPFNKKHGAPTAVERHVGDLGNIQSDKTGAAQFTLTDNLISLNGPLSIVGRAVVLHAVADDLGLGGNAESLKTGNAGARAACGVIGIAEFR
ncbi:superoxide dismutase [Multifurca ochricompacta]|uniref:Superoxide dismutase [Cu-Zn] n=1 Tax=Multifurca ochricompacta TaxID=376703 RepID=A0AAD4QMJ4_9AGAM|nr:superoxide dismutase [Multifurca ochricompacta]